LGCSAGELGNVLKALGFWAERRKLSPPPGDAIVPQAVTLPAGGNGAGTAPASDPPTEAAGGGQAPGGASADGVAAPPPDLPAACVAPPTEPAARTQGHPEGALKAGQWEEVWRPRRKGRTFETAPERRGQQRARASDKAQQDHPKPGSPGGKPRGRR